MPNMAKLDVLKITLADFMVLKPEEKEAAYKEADKRIADAHGKVTISHDKPSKPEHTKLPERSDLHGGTK